MVEAVGQPHCRSAEGIRTTDLEDDMSIGLKVLPGRPGDHAL